MGRLKRWAFEDAQWRLTDLVSAVAEISTHPEARLFLAEVIKTQNAIFPIASVDDLQSFAVLALARCKTALAAEPEERD